MLSTRSWANLVSPTKYTYPFQHFGLLETFSVLRHADHLPFLPVDGGIKNGRRNRDLCVVSIVHDVDSISDESERLTDA